MESWGIQNHKDPIKKTFKKHKKHKTAKCASMAAFELQEHVSFRTGRVIKITTIPQILKTGSRGCLEPPTSLKITILTSQTLENPMRTARFLHSCFQHFLTTCLKKVLKTGKLSCKLAQKLHGGGLCAQRTGYQLAAID